MVQDVLPEGEEQEEVHVYQCISMYRWSYRECTVAVMRTITLLGGSSSFVSRVNRRSSGGKLEGGGLKDQVEDDR